MFANSNSKGHPRSLLSFINNIINKKYAIIGGLLGFIFFVLPILELISLSFIKNDNLSFSNYSTILLENRTWTTLINTFWIVAGSLFLSLVLGVTMAWLVAYSNIRGKKYIQAILFIPFVIPSYIISLSWIQLFNSVNLPFEVYSFTGMILVMGICHCPLIFLMTVSVFRKIPKELEAAARASGCNRLKIFWKITLPMVYPGIASGSLLAFLAALDNFGIPAFLGITANINVLSTTIYQEIVGFATNSFNRAATLSVLLGVIALIGSLSLWYFARKAKRIDTYKEDFEPRIDLGKYRIGVEILIWLFLLASSIIPLLSMVKTSLIKAYGLDFTLKNLTFNHYKFVLFQSDKTINAISNSLILAGVTTIVCLIVGTILAYYRVRKNTNISRLLEIVVSVPYALPGIVFSLAIIITWMEPSPGWNPGLYGTINIIFIAYFARFMILQVRGSITSMMQIDASMEEAARVSGAGLITRWRKILLPLLFSGIMGAALLVLIKAFTELTVSSILWSSGSETIGVVIFNFEQAGYTTYSTAFSSLIVILIFIGFGLFNMSKKMWQRRQTE